MQREQVYTTLLCAMLYSPRYHVWVSNGDERFGGENESIKQASNNASQKRAYPVHIVISPFVRVLRYHSRAETPYRVHGTTSQGIARQKGQVTTIICTCICLMYTSSNQYNHTHTLLCYRTYFYS